MDTQRQVGGSLQISNDVLVKIAQIAAMEIDGVTAVSSESSQSVQTLLGMTNLQKPVKVTLEDGIASVKIYIVADYGKKIMPICEKVQDNVKSAIQNMTGIMVSRVDVVVAGLSVPAQD